MGYIADLKTGQLDGKIPTNFRVKSQVPGLIRKSREVFILAVSLLIEIRMVGSTAFETITIGIPR
jgi:hypothetical protein